MNVQLFQRLDDPNIAHLLKNGAIAVLPTDTVYGLVCAASDSAAVQRLFKLKEREAKPGTVLAASVQQLIDLGIRARYLQTAAYYWPNPISVIMPCDDRLAYLHQGKQSLAVRIPDDPLLRGLLKISGPLMTTSANLPGEPVCQTAAEAKTRFGTAVDLYVDAGSLGSRLPSTIIRVHDDGVEVVRRGAVKLDETGKILHE